METYISSNNRTRPIITQIQNNTTIWIGHLQTDPTDRFAGQTFISPSSGELNNIQVYSAFVQNPGEVLLTIHEFDGENKTWGPVLASSVRDIEKGDEEGWVRFNLPPMPLRRNDTYGFRVHAIDAMVALGEAASGMQAPFSGQEWYTDSIDQEGRYYSYFSLAFKVELCA